MSMNAVVISLFLGGLALCIVTGASLLWALAFGLLCFTGHAFRLGFRPREIVGLCGRGVRTIGNILKIFVLIGMLTAVWRSAGTIPYIIHHCLPWVDPAHFHLWVFLLCSLLSLLLGTSFGTASTLGVVFMLLARTAGLDPLLTAGAVMSGIYVGDRSSPMSSSAALVCALTGTSIYDNVRLMWRTSLLPFFLVCLAYVLLPSARAESLPHVDGLFADGLVLDARALLPAVFMLVPLLLRWDVKKIMACSILAGCVVSLAVQQMSPAALLRCLVFGYEPPAGMEMLAGGGLLSMAQVAGIVLLTSAYAGLLEATGLLDVLTAGGLSDHGAGRPARGCRELQPDARHHADEAAVRPSLAEREGDGPAAGKRHRPAGGHHPLEHRRERSLRHHGRGTGVPALCFLSVYGAVDGYAAAAPLRRYPGGCRAGESRRPRPFPRVFSALSYAVPASGGEPFPAVCCM